MSLISYFKNYRKQKIETKFAKIEGQEGFSLISGQGNARKEKYNAEDLLKLNKAWVYVCNSKNAMQIATTKLSLFYKNNKGAKLLTPSHKIDKQLKGIVLKQQEEIVEIEKHPILDLLDKVNDELNYVDFCSYIQQYLGLMGNAYVFVEKDGSGNPIALYPLLSEKVTIRVEDKDANKIVGYKYNNKIIPYDDVIQFINYCPGQLVSGKGELEYCMDAALRYQYYDQLEHYLNQNNARPDFVVAYKGRLTETEQKDLMNLWYKKFGSVTNAGKPIITNSEAGVDITTLGYSPREMQYEVGRRWAREEIAGVYGVPNTLLQLNEANYASSASAQNFYLSNTIYPKLAQWCSRLNEKLLPYYDDSGKLFLWYTENLKTDPKSQAETLTTYTNSGILTINEAREKIGMPPLDNVEEITTSTTTQGQE